jgi:outer membrane murein-binding lipoprotein Lpp
MDTQKIAHIVTELLVVGGITVHFNGQIKTLKTQVQDLSAKIVEQNDTFNKHLNNIYAVMDKLNQQHIQSIPPRPSSPERPIKSNLGIRRRKGDNNNRQPVRDLYNSSNVVEQIYVDLSENLDTELEEELYELQKQEQVIEVIEENSEEEEYEEEKNDEKEFKGTDILMTESVKKK